MERRHGSVIKGMQAAAEARAANTETSGARWSLFQSFKNGMATLPETLAARLADRFARALKLSRCRGTGMRGGLRPVVAIRSRCRCRWDDLRRRLAYAAARIVATSSPSGGEDASVRVSYASAATVNLTFRESDFDPSPRAFGFVGAGKRASANNRRAAFRASNSKGARRRRNPGARVCRRAR